MYIYILNNTQMYPSVIVNLPDKTYLITQDKWVEVPVGSKLQDFPQYNKPRESAIPQTIKREHKVPSSTPGKYYVVTQENNQYSCTCTGYLYRNRCKHVELAKSNV